MYKHQIPKCLVTRRLKPNSDQEDQHFQRKQSVRNETNAMTKMNIKEATTTTT